MAYHFSANQFEDKYSPRKLGNWEHPKWYPERPRQRFKSTKIIADDNGRLLDGIKRENPWGNYVGTWDLPKRITREYVKKLVEPPERLVNLWGKKKKTPPELKPQEESVEKEEKTECLPILDQNANSLAQKSFERRNKSCSALDLRPRPTKLEPLASLQEKNDSPRKPGNLDEKIKKILESVEEKQKPDLSPADYCKEIKAFPRRSKQKVEPICPGNKPQEDGEDRYKYLNALEDHLNKFESVAEDVEEEKDEVLNFTQFQKSNSPKMKDEKSTKPMKSEYGSSFQIAKRYHDENLRHKPLPDVIDDPVFKALTSARHPNPAEALMVQPVPSAIGWKPYSAPGPTECSKLKVFRPKTAVDKIKPQKEIRPKTGGSGTLKKRFLPIDLAICWDLKPDDPSDEPKRTPHIDGSNGSAAPAVFTMIKPAEAEEDDIPGSCQAVAERITKGINENNAVALPSQNGKPRTPLSVTSNREAIMSCIKSPEQNKSKTNTPNSINSISTNAAEYARKNPKTAWTNEDTSKALSDRLMSLQNEKRLSGTSPGKCFESYRNKNHHQSTPNLANVCDGSHCGTEKSSPGSSKPRSCGSANNGSSKVQKNGQKKNRSCSACDRNNTETQELREKSEFKSAFKAGVPNSESSHSGTSNGSKSYKVPKMRLPYAKRSYSIGTLAPPFSLWRERNGQEYPEHWRLASVYQHSYKPINSRKRPLLASVYQ